MHRRLGLEIMYSKGCLATGCDAGKAFLHKGESNVGAPQCVLVCTIHSMQEVGHVFYCCFLSSLSILTSLCHRGWTRDMKPFVTKRIMCKKMYKSAEMGT